MKKFTLDEYQQLYLNNDRLQKCYDEKWFKLFVPKAYAGLELSMTEGCEQLFNIAAIQGGLGWAVNLGAGANWFSGFFEDEIARELFSPETAVIAGSGFASGEWQATDRSYQISGQWSKCTGANHASLFTVIANNVEHGPKTFVVPRASVTLSDDKWPIMGMRNSSSFDISLQQAEVPLGYDFQINSIKNNAHYSVFHLPFQSFARLCMSASFLGVSQCLINYCFHTLNKPLALELIDNTLKPLISASKNTLFETANQVEAQCLAGQYHEKDEQKMAELLGANNLQIFDAIQKLFLAGGLAFIEEDTLVHWAYRDVLTAVQHFMVKP